LTLVSITRLRVRSLRYLLAFLLGSLRSAREAKNASGNLAVSLLSDAHLAFWTRTLWTDERSMRAFMFAPAHRAVMPKLLEWCDEAAVTHWLQETAVVAGGPSSPATGRAHLQGRSYFRAQMRFEIPPQKTTRQLTLKSPPHAQGLST
jgi:hypothetical protein